MNKYYSRVLGILFTYFFLLAFSHANAQTFTFHDVDAGAYTPGSSIAAPFTIDYNSGCIAQNNVFQLYLSDANGSFASEKMIGTFSGFYATFVNGTIPMGTPDGVGYRLRVKATASGTVSAPSTPITIRSGDAVNAALDGNFMQSQKYPNNNEIFGYCTPGRDGTRYFFSDKSTSAGNSIPEANLTTTFYKENDGTREIKSVVNNSVDITAKATNYTIIEKAFNGNSVSTRAYQLINNSVQSSFSAVGTYDFCLIDNQNTATAGVDPQALASNYPGNIYIINFGDGTVFNLSACDLKALNYKVSHTYTSSSCGKQVNTGNTTTNNAYPVTAKINTPYCDGDFGQTLSTNAKVYKAPVNNIILPKNICEGSNIEIKNDSYPGQNLQSGGVNCVNDNALFTWTLDGKVVLKNAKITQSYIYQNATPGMHTIGLELQTVNNFCDYDYKEFQICVPKAPKPNFEVSPDRICNSTVFTPTDKSDLDVLCNVHNPYKWYVSGPGAVRYVNGTSNTDIKPQMQFTTPGVYTIKLSISTDGCGEIFSPEHQLIVDATPTAVMSTDKTLCSKNTPVTFSPTSGDTQTTLTGTAQPAADTYTWTVTGNPNYEFANGSNANSQYPTIIFHDNATYTVTVTHKNACNPAGVTASQNLTFQDAPTVDPGTYQPFCSTDIIQLNATIGDVASFKWLGNGTFSSTTVKNPVYTPTAAERAAGQATVQLEATTNLAGECHTITRPVTLTIIPQAVVNSSAIATICSGQPVSYTITSPNPATYTWTAQPSANVSGATPSGSGSSSIGDVLTSTDGKTGTVKYIITPTSQGCPGQPFTLTVTVHPLPVGTATVADPLICSNQPANIKLSSTVASTSYTWVSTTTGNIKGNSTQTTPVSASDISDLLINTGTDKATVTYTITPYNGTCAGTSFTATVTVQPLPVTANAGADEEVCNVTTYTLKGNSPLPGTGKWTVSSGQAGVTFSDDTQPNAVVNGLIPGNTYKFTWTITAAPTCPPSANTVTIIDDKASNGGITAGPSTPVCSSANSGTITLTGNTGSILRWESSEDGGKTWNTLVNTTTSQSYLNLAVTTQYRAVVQNGKCDIAYSSVSTVTVSAATVAANAGADQSLCNAATATLTANNPAPFAGVWTQTAGPAVTIATPNNYQTEVTGLTGGNTYKFTWTIKGVAPCSDIPDEVVILNKKDVTPKFTASQASGCGATSISFTNTSTSTTGTQFTWDFGDGSAPSAVINPSHTFQPRTDGKDTTYVVSLNVANNCAVHPPATFNVTVSPAAPVAAILPLSTSGCSPFILTVKNVSPGTNKSYDFYLYDGSTLLQKITKTDKSNVTFSSLSPTVSKDYSLYMVATNNCGTSSQSLVSYINVSPARITPQFFSKNNITKGCYPLSVTLQNNTNGGTDFHYNVYDASGKIIASLVAGKADFNYTFPAVGDYSISITAIDDCTPTGIESAKTAFHVYAVPQPAFTGNQLSACSTLSVSFTNKTPADASGTPATSLNYTWDFGDGKQSSEFNPTHLYSQPGKYTVTLTAYNQATTCSNSVMMSNYITVTAPPLTDFRVSPDTVTEIPNYQFNFTDETTGSPASWRWTFGDNTPASTAQNPSHTYADTGRYTVTLITTNASGCSSTKIRHVRITGVPGQLFVPNAFMPNSATAELRTFMAKGSGIKAYHLQIFNNWGQLIWETTRLSSKGEPLDSWDGTFKGEPVPQGVYVWQMSATFINGNEWKGMSYNNSSFKRTGPIHLIR